jgi:xanthine/uracil permease
VIVQSKQQQHWVQQRYWPVWVVGAAALMIGVSIAHVLEDFVYGIPARFGIEIAPAAALLGLAYLIHIVLVALAGRGHIVGYLGNLAAGVLWLAAVIIDHLGEILFVSPYRAGFLSKSFEVGLMISALALAMVSLAAWRSKHRVG